MAILRRELTIILYRPDDLDTAVYKIGDRRLDLLSFRVHSCMADTATRIPTIISARSQTTELEAGGDNSGNGDQGHGALNPINVAHSDSSCWLLHLSGAGCDR